MQLLCLNQIKGWIYQGFFRKENNKLGWLHWQKRSIDILDPIRLSVLTPHLIRLCDRLNWGFHDQSMENSDADDFRIPEPSRERGTLRQHEHFIVRQSEISLVFAPPWLFRVGMHEE